ncbi:hypothetical protein N4Q63_09990 [Leclercia adecarboxylata]|uniref:Uncharacterized protein n=1 Tax=Leclercia adecarboxylata TaxID=83655 RepID=A0A9X4BDX6_9ENTR|nr:hypothetical protein [Leclercia adecarboxylata]MBD1404999.1 hypothetical protein [Leclercia adecarboxylata]MDC6622377.1 hypothetical protein [Leclercia adecarboxylata]MDC6633449.1 hypothetical protein [Leclercia adecarboxylata]MDC6638560.1 hypothetical protein [Leclercia adecarboxylata]MDC6649069.1 hypothetical protein [Leclercia adecarboxylata]
MKKNVPTLQQVVFKRPIRISLHKMWSNGAEMHHNEALFWCMATPSLTVKLLSANIDEKTIFR